jgi:hypothetical protein
LINNVSPYNVYNTKIPEFGLFEIHPIWNEIRFCERAIATSRAFSSVIIAHHSNWYEEK